MKIKQLILRMLTVTVFTFVGVAATGQNKSGVDTTKQDTVIYTCTMHPEIQSRQSGVCPKCGMDLVKKSELSENKQKKHKMKMMSMMMGGMNGMDNMENTNSADNNKTTTDSRQKDTLLYTCSMHPEIQSSQPGNCPKCGMTLIKKTAISGKKAKHHKIPSLGIGMGLMMVGMLFFVMRH
jgi:uncharacterized paraquat-inducible protein A